MENGVGGGLVKGLAKILGAGGKSSAAALKGALEDLPAQPPPAAGELRPPQGRRGRDPDREGAAALPARTLAPPLREARRRVRPPHAGRVPQGRPRPDGTRGHRDLHPHQRRQASSTTPRATSSRSRGPTASCGHTSSRRTAGTTGWSSSPRDDRRPRPRPRAARGARPAPRRSHARLAAPGVGALRHGRRARLRRLDLRVHERPLRPRSPRAHRRRREPRAAGATGASARGRRRALRGGDRGGRAPARREVHHVVVAARAAPPASASSPTTSALSRSSAGRSSRCE